MSMQIAVRLPNRVVEFLDQTVSEGRAPSRAAIVTSAIEREMRYLMANRDVELLTRAGALDDLDGLVDWTQSNIEIES